VSQQRLRHTRAVPGTSWAPGPARRTRRTSRAASLGGSARAGGRSRPAGRARRRPRARPGAAAAPRPPGPPRAPRARPRAPPAAAPGAGRGGRARRARVCCMAWLLCKAEYPRANATTWRSCPATLCCAACCMPVGSARRQCMLESLQGEGVNCRTGCMQMLYIQCSPAHVHSLVPWAAGGCSCKGRHPSLMLARLELRQEAVQRGERGRRRAPQGLLRGQHGGPEHVQQLCAGPQRCSAQPPCAWLPPGDQPVRPRQRLLISGASKQARWPVTAPRELLQGKECLARPATCAAAGHHDPAAALAPAMPDASAEQKMLRSSPGTRQALTKASSSRQWKPSGIRALSFSLRAAPLLLLLPSFSEVK